MAKTEVRASQIKDELTDTDFASANKDGTASTYSLRTLGTGAQQACAGNDSRLTDSRAPSGSAGGDLAGTYPNPTISKTRGSCWHRLIGNDAVPFSGAAGNALTQVYLTPTQSSDLPLYHSTTGEAVYSDVPGIGLFLGTVTASLGYDVFCLADFGTPSSVDSVLHVMTFSAAVGWQTGAWIRVLTGGGGLTAGTDYWYRAATTTTGTFYTSLANAISDTSRVSITAIPGDATLLGVSLEKLAWTSATARATAVTFQGRAYRKSGDKSRLLVGSFYTTSTTTTESSATKSFISSFYNRKPHEMSRLESAGSWAGDGTNTWRKWNNSATNRLEWFECWDMEPHSFNFMASGSGSNPPYLGVGLDSTTAPSGRWGFCALAGGPFYTSLEARPGIGYHYAQALEKAAAGVTFYGTSAGDVQFGLEGRVMA